MTNTRNTEGNLCSTCNNALWCATWGQYKCLAKQRHITGVKTVCDTYTKLRKGCVMGACRCEDCLENDLLATQRAEEAEDE